MGERGPKPMPANLRLLNGNAGHRPLASLLDGTVRPAVEIPECPAHLEKDAAAEWARITPHLAALGLISQVDRAALAAYCYAWGEWVWATQRIRTLNETDPTGERGRIMNTGTGYKQIGVLQQQANRALEMMAKYLAEFGLSPASRSRVTPSEPQGELPGLEKPRTGGWGAFK